MPPDAKWSGASIRRATAIALLPLAFTALVGGCPGKLEDPDRFLEGDGGPFVCPDMVSEVFPQRCGGTICHEGANAAAGLDLVSPGVVSRLVDQMGRDCPGILVDPVDPTSSLLYEKLLPLPECGSPMPIGKPAFTLDELECVRNWIAAQTPTGGGTRASAHTSGK